MIQKEKISGQKIFLRSLTAKNATLKYCDWLNDPEVNKYLETRQCTIYNLKKYIQAQNKNPQSIFLGVFDKNNNNHIGNVKLEPIDWLTKKAVFGIMVGDKNYWGKGYGSEAIKLALMFAFKNLKLTGIELGVIAENKKARHVFEKCGFKKIKIVKNALNHDGVLFDKVIMRIQK